MSNHPLMIEGVVTTTSPLHVSAFDTSTGGGAATKTMMQPLAKFIEFTKRDQGQDADGNDEADAVDLAADALGAGQEEPKKGLAQLRIPIVGSNGVRGKIRRAAIDEVERSLRDRGVRVSVETYYAMRNGSAAGGNRSKKAGGEGRFDGPLSAEHCAAVYANVVAGVFGVVNQWESRLNTSGLTPILPETLELGMIPDRFAGAAITVEDLRRMIYVQYMTKGDPILQFEDAIAEDLIEGGAEKIIAYQKMVLENETKRAEDKEKGRVGEDRTRKANTRNILSHECVVPGVPMFQEVSLNAGVDDIHIGLVLIALREFCRGNSIGGMRRYCYGRFDAVYQVRVRGVDVPDAIVSKRGDVEMAPELQPYVEAAEKAIKSLSAKELKNVFENAWAVGA